MPKEFIAIDSFDDVPALFKELCKINEISEIDAKRLLIGFKGNDSNVKNTIVSAENIATMCQKKGLKVSFKLSVEYDGVITEKSSGEVVPDKYSGQKVTNQFEEMQRQKELIKPGVIEIPDFPS